jgi:hypothetical protein
MSKVNLDPDIVNRVLAAARKMQAVRAVGYVDGTPYYTGAELEELALACKFYSEILEEKDQMIAELRTRLATANLIAYQMSEKTDYTRSS